MSLPTTMKTAVVTAYGGPDTVVIEERPVPVPRANEILFKIFATTVNSGDARIRALNLPAGFGPIGRLMFGFGKPRQPVLGTELTGVVAAVGRSVTRFKEGDAIIAFPGLGSHQEYRVLAENKPVALKPTNLSYKQAAALCFGGTTALHFLHKAGVKAGEDILVIGASGTVGSAMVQLARHMGLRVTTATSRANLKLMDPLGAHAVLDYTQSDYTRQTAAYDVIADTVGASSLEKCLDALKPGGRYLAIAAGLREMFISKKGDKRQISGMAPERREDVEMLADLAARGLFTPLIDSVFSFADIAKAHARVDSGRKRGSVVVRMT